MNNLKNTLIGAFSLNRRSIRIIASVFAILTMFLTLSIQVTSAERVSVPEYDKEEGAYLVEDLADLNYIRKDLDNDYILKSDIDAKNAENFYDGRGWLPLGNDDTSFSGYFNGQGHRIKNIHINRPDSSYIGLFGWIGREGVVSDVKIEKVSVVGHRNVGSLAGYSNGKVRNSTSSGVVDGDTNSGGLVGYNSSLLSCSSSSVTVKGGKNVGGILGYNAGEGVLVESYAVGNVEGGLNVGGLVGYNSEGTVEDGKGVIERAYAEGDVFGYRWVGGFVGTNFGEVDVCYARGDVEGSSYVGGFMGGVRPGGSVDEVYSSGKVKGENDVGGFSGYKNNDSSVSASYWCKESNSVVSSEGGVGLSRGEMKGSRASNSMRGLDFGKNWKIVKDGYPVIRGLESGGEKANLSTDYVSYRLYSIGMLVFVVFWRSFKS